MYHKFLAQYHLGSRTLAVRKEFFRTQSFDTAQSVRAIELLHKDIIMVILDLTWC